MKERACARSLLRSPFAASPSPTIPKARSHPPRSWPKPPTAVVRPKELSVLLTSTARRGGSAKGVVRSAASHRKSVPTADGNSHAWSMRTRVKTGRRDHNDERSTRRCRQEHHEHEILNARHAMHQSNRIPGRTAEEQAKTRSVPATNLSTPQRPAASTSAARSARPSRSAPTSIASIESVVKPSRKLGVGRWSG